MGAGLAEVLKSLALVLNGVIITLLTITGFKTKSDKNDDE